MSPQHGVVATNINMVEIISSPHPMYNATGISVVEMNEISESDTDMSVKCL